MKTTMTKQDLESVLPLIHSITHKYKVPNHEQEDLFQECLTKLWEVRDEYDNDYELTTFTWTVLTNHLSTLAKKESNTFNMNHIQINGVDNIVKDTKKYDLKKHVENIPYSPKEKDVLFTAYTLLENDYKDTIENILKGYTVRQIGKLEGVSHQAIQQRWSRFVKKVRSEIE